MNEAISLTMSTTALVFFILFFALMFYDMIVVLFKGTTSSVSQLLINLGFKSPVFCVTFGAALEHLFFYMIPTDQWGPNKEPLVLLEKNAYLIICTILIYEGVRRIFTYIIGRIYGRNNSSN